MTNKEKMLCGKYYLSFDKELTIERERAKDLLFDFNNTRPSLRSEREKLIRNLFGYVGENCWIESTFNCDYGYNIYVGDICVNHIRKREIDKSVTAGERNRRNRSFTCQSGKCIIIQTGKNYSCCTACHSILSFLFLK